MLRELAFADLFAIIHATLGIQLMPTINGKVLYEIDANCTLLASALRKRGKER